MQCNAYSTLFQAEVRHAELQARAARFHLMWRVPGDGPSIQDAVAVVRFHLGTTLVRARERLDAIGVKPIAMRRGAHLR